MNPNRPTETWKLALVGLAGGVIIAVFAFWTGGDDAEVTRRSAASMGAWSVRLLIFGALVAGGWKALRRPKV